MSCSFVLRCSLAPAFCIPLSLPKGILGRSAKSDYVVDDKTISRSHAEISVRESGLHVVDLESTNGTFVDSLQIQTHQVVAGQIVRFGSVSFAVLAEQVQYPFEEETGRPQAPGYVNGKLIQARETLTEAQLKVFDLLMTGGAEKMIASKLRLSQHTVHNHVRAIFRAFDVHSRAELFARFQGNGHASPEA